MNIKTPECVGNALAHLYIAGATKLLQDSAKSIEPDWSWGLKNSLLEKLIYLVPVYSYHLLEEGLFNEDTYNPAKILGPVSLIEVKTNFSFFDSQTGFQIKKGDPYLSIHLNKPEDDSKSPVQAVKEGMARTACYLEKFGSELPSDLIVGLTYPTLANASRRYGFTVIEQPVPEKIRKKYLEHMRTRTSSIPYSVKDAKFCVQKAWQFRATWGLSHKRLPI